MALDLSAWNGYGGTAADPNLAPPSYVTQVAPTYVGSFGAPSVGTVDPNVGAVAPYQPIYSAPPTPTYTAPSTQQLQDWVLNSPEFKQQMEYLNTANQTNLARDAALWPLQIAAMSSGGGGGGGSTQTVPQSFYDQIKLAKEKAAHDWELQKAAIPEIAASHGMLSSGNTEFQKTEGQYQYDTVIKDIELQKKAREEAVAQANKASAAGAGAGAAQSAIRMQIATLEHQYALEDAATKLANDRLGVINSVATYYQNSGLIWNGTGYVPA